MSDISDLQVRITFQEDLLEELNKRVCEQQIEIDALKFQLNYLYQKVSSVSEKNTATLNILDEKPPHY